MGLRGVVLIVLVAASSLSAETRWRAMAAAPLPGLPEVEVELGYGEDYLPAVNTPVTLRARSGERPFDGYIGYHTAVGNRRAYEMPVAARAEMRPYSQWTFSTSIRLPMGTHGWAFEIATRELVIEWRDRGRNVLAQRSIGAPPWTKSPRPLRVVRPGEAADAKVLGQDAVLLPASSLSGDAQWYSGFSTVAMPLPLWLELPRGIQDAIFRSAVRVVFIGTPGRTPDAVGRVATFVADERALRDPLPEPGNFAIRLDPVTRPLPTPGEIFRDYRPAVFFTLFAALSVAAWLLIRRRPRVLVFAGMVAITLLAIGWRKAIRPAVARHSYERLTIVGPGIFDRFSVGELTGAGGGVVLAGPVRQRDDLEVRTSRTAPGFGDLHLPGRAWVLTPRATIRRELGTPATLRIRSQDATQLVLEYDSTMSVDYVAACWWWNRRPYYGEVRAGARRGTATIRHGDRVWPDLGRALRQGTVFESRSNERNPGISLIHLERDRTIVITRRTNR